MKFTKEMAKAIGYKKNKNGIWKHANYTAICEKEFKEGLSLDVFVAQVFMDGVVTGDKKWEVPEAWK